MFFTASLHRRFPINFLLLGAFTAVEAVSLGMVSMLYDVEAVLIAVGITTGIVLALTVFAFQVSDLEFIVFSNCDIDKHNLDFILVLCSAPSVPQPVVQSRRRPLLGPSPG